MKGSISILLLLMCLPFLKVRSQNLVPNPSFENFSANFNGPSNFNYLNDWNSFSSPEWHHVNNIFPISPYPTSVPNNFVGHQYPNTGLGYASIISSFRLDANNREPMSVKLIDTLRAGKSYCVRFYVSLADSSYFACSKLAAAFTTALPVPTGLGPPTYNFWPDSIIPQVVNTSGFITDTVNWVKVEGSFIATQDLAWLTLGVFGLGATYDTLQFNSSLTSPTGYYYFDDVSVEEVKNVHAGNDTVLYCGADSIVLGINYDENATYEWYPKLNMNDSTLAKPTVWVTQPVTYYVKKTQCGYISYDTINIGFQAILPANAGATINTCINQTVTLGSSVNDGSSYQWQPVQGLNDPTSAMPQLNASILGVTQYVLTKTNVCTVVTTDTVLVTVKPTLPLLNAVAAVDSICSGQSLNVQVSPTYNGLQYSWQPAIYFSTPNLFNSMVTANATELTVTITSNGNDTFCVSTFKDTLILKLLDCIDSTIEPIIPNVFSPNGDGINDTWLVTLNGDFTLNEVEVFNRWGIKVFSTTELLKTNNSSLKTVTWDGRTTSGIACEEGTYFYCLELKSPNGELKKYKGFVTLVR